MFTFERRRRRRRISTAFSSCSISFVHAEFMLLSIFLLRYPKLVVFIQKDNLENIALEITDNALLPLNVHRCPHDIVGNVFRMRKLGVRRKFYL